MNSRVIGILAVLAVVVALTAWLQDSAVPPAKEPEVLTSKHSIDFYMEAYDATVMNEQGKRSHRIISPKMVHFPDDDTAEYDSPYMLIYREQGNPWQINARRGWSATKGDSILLTGDVVLNRKKSAHNEAMKLETEKLRVLPDDEYAETDTAVVMYGENQKTTARGMRAYLAKGQIQLLDEVKTRYEN